MPRQPKDPNQSPQQPNSNGKPPRRKKSNYGAGSVYQLKDGRFAGSIKDSNSGKRIVRYGKTHKEAEKKLEDIKFEIRQGTLATGPNQTVEQFLTRWLNDVYRMEVRDSSYAQREVLLRVHIIPALGHLQMRKLSPEHVQTFYTKKLREGLKPATVDSFHTLLHKAFKTAVRWKLVPYNVCDQVTPPSLKDQEEGIALTMEQAITLLKACQGHNLEPLITLVLLTGMRHGEVNALRWDDINFEEGYLLVRHTVGYIPKKGFVERAPKTRKSKREIMLPGLALEALEKQRVLQRATRERAGDQWVDHNLVFPNPRGGFLYDHATRESFYRVLKKAGLPKLRIHDLRHTTSTLLQLDLGQPEKLVQELLGHENIEMTRGKYTHANRNALRKMMEEVDRKFRGFL
jgi:integrase